MGTTKQKNLEGKSVLKTEIPEDSFFNVKTELFEKVPFLKWEKESYIVQFDFFPQNEDLIHIPGKFGKSVFVNVLNIESNQRNLLKIDSKRLREQLICIFSENVFPLKIKLQRIGSGFNTTYSANKVE